MIRILVCLKQVAYLYSRIGIHSKGKIDPDGLVHIVNPYDEVALEEALRIRQGADQAEVILISMGPPRVEAALKYGLAMGADRAIHVCDERLENLDPWVKSKALVKVIETQGFDLILFGKKAIDDNGGVLGGFVAEWLNLPYVSSVTEIVLTADRKRARMHQVLARGNRQLIECDLPALLSVERGVTRPRYPTLMGRLIASRKEISKVDLLEVGIGSLTVFETAMKAPKLSISRPKPKKIFTPDSSLSAEERIKLMMSGGLTEKKSSFAKGSSQELAQQFISFVDENRILRKKGGSS